MKNVFEFGVFDCLFTRSSSTFTSLERLSNDVVILGGVLVGVERGEMSKCSAINPRLNPRESGMMDRASHSLNSHKIHNPTGFLLWSVGNKTD